MAAVGGHAGGGGIGGGHRLGGEEGRLRRSLGGIATAVGGLRLDAVVGARVCLRLQQLTLGRVAHGVGAAMLVSVVIDGREWRSKGSEGMRVPMRHDFHVAVALSGRQHVSRRARALSEKVTGMAQERCVWRVRRGEAR